MTRLFAGPPIPGLVEAMLRILGERTRPIDQDALVAALRAAGFDGPQVPDHVAWLAVGDPRIVRGRPA